MTGIPGSRFNRWLPPSLAIVAVLGIGFAGVRQSIAQPAPIIAQPAIGPILTVFRLKGRVIGTLVTFAATSADVGAQKSRGPIELPDILVTLRAPGGAPVATGPTRLDGSFDIVTPRTGIFTPCWQIPGNPQQCGPALQVGRSTVYAGRLSVRAGRPPLTGTILTGDGRPCWISDSFFGLDVSTKVTARNALNNIGSPAVRANTQGEYAVFNLAPGRYQVAASCEAAKITRLVALGGGGARVDAVLPNRAPRIGGLSDDGDTTPMLRADPGATVNLRATAIDLEGDAIEYRWRTTGPDGSLDGATTAQQTWALPAGAGLRSTYVMARDGRGGFAFRRIQLRAGPNVRQFSGLVRHEITQAPVKDAQVTVAGGTATTDARGWFAMTVQPLADDRYVLNITHPQFARLSRVHDQTATGTTYELIPAAQQVFPPNGIVDIDDKSGGFCGARGPTGGPPLLLRRAGLTVLREDFVRRDDSGLDDRRRAARLLAMARAFQKLDCRPRGVQIVIPAGGLVDSDGNAAVGAITASTASLNPARRAIPGDYQAVTAGGQLAEVLSFGATYAEFRGGDGKALDLKPGVLAEVRIPVPLSQIADAKPTIALWSYDGKQGRWIEEGIANLVATPVGPMYVGKAKHFSELNMDVAGLDPAFATCVRFQVAPGAFAGWTDLSLKAYVSFGGSSVQIKETALDGAAYHAVFRIPFNTGTPNSLRVEVRGTFNNQRVVLLDDIIDTDNRPKMTGTDLWPRADNYAACGEAVQLSEAPGVVPQYGYIDGAGRPYFLLGPGDTRFNPVDGLAAATAYYAAIDPNNDKDTLGKWWQENDFGPSGEGTNASFTRASYMNHNDLGFGRDMNCQKTGSNVACYVTNYGLPNQNPQNANDAEDRNLATQAATVTMEFNAAAGNNEKVQFYVFGGGDATSGRLKFADLDGFGGKAVPYLCLICHGGTVNAANKVQHARFREFDMPTFRYSDNRSWDFSGAASNTLNNAELTAFARLNQMVEGTTGGLPIGRLITAWYPGGFAGAVKPVLPAPPPGWDDNASHISGYHLVYGPSCRACHLARDENNGDAAAFVFASQSNFASRMYAVCGSGYRIMPNAVITYKNMWASTSRIAQLEALTGQTAGSCDDD